ncbi:DUF1206 domain-containing protein [Pseudonocardia sp.]|uniref:DUF1206 domain-containing protein n=1 Tax=Pseudonocardia sp. TaxID=60912 RepID=UPI003D0B91E1
MPRVGAGEEVSSREDAADVAEDLAESKPMRILGRIGLVAYGGVNLVIASLAAQVAFGDAERADKTGALATVAETGFGRVALWLAVAGLAALVLWTLAEVVFGHRRLPTKRRVLRSAIDLAEAGIFATLAVSAAKIAAGGSSQGSVLTAVLGRPGGQWLVGAAGVGIAVLAGFAVWRGVRGGFRRDLDMSRCGPRLGRIGVLAGHVGWVALGCAYLTAGVLTVRAAVRYDPAQPVGLDAGVKTLAAQPYGPALLLVLAAGVAVFGLYCLFDARCRKK